MNYNNSTADKISKSPNVIYRNDRFLSHEDIEIYQNLLKNNRWTLGNNDSFEKIDYMSQDLYQHYKWDGDWDNVNWLDHVPVEWELLHNKISQHLPRHYVHWVDVKITSTGQQGTPVHRDKDPWRPGGDAVKFKRAISIVCNLNTIWDPSWGGGFVLYNTNVEHGKVVNTISETVPISPGQLLVVENCHHSIEPITEVSKSRISFILHVLEYNNDSN
jgi:hypothetical protein